MPGTVNPVFAILTAIAALGVFALCLLPASDSDSTFDWPSPSSVATKMLSCVTCGTRHGSSTRAEGLGHPTWWQRVPTVGTYFQSKDSSVSGRHRRGIFGPAFDQKKSIPLTATDELQLNVLGTPRRHDHNSPFARNYHVPISTADDVKAAVPAPLTPCLKDCHSPFGANPNRHSPSATEDIRLQLTFPQSPTPRNADCNRRGMLQLQISIPQSPKGARCDDPDLYLRIHDDARAKLSTHASDHTPGYARAKDLDLAGNLAGRLDLGPVAPSKTPTPWFMIKFLLGMCPDAVAGCVLCVDCVEKGCFSCHTFSACVVFVLRCVRVGRASSRAT